MSLSDYTPKPGASDFFEAEEDNHFCFPCSACIARYNEDDQEPCAHCCHNATATEDVK